MGNPPRIQTLRGDGKLPPTSDCFTPRTMVGNDGAFKGAEYGAFLEGPYSAPGRAVTGLAWVAAAVMVVLTLTLALLKF